MYFSNPMSKMFFRKPTLQNDKNRLDLNLQLPQPNFSHPDLALAATLPCLKVNLPSFLSINFFAQIHFPQQLFIILLPMTSYFNLILAPKLRKTLTYFPLTNTWLVGYSKLHIFMRLCVYLLKQILQTRRKPFLFSMT